MTGTTRRDLLALAAGTVTSVGASPLSVPALAAASGMPRATDAPSTGWGRSYEGQRCADRGDGTYLNPILAGCHADPSILKDGEDYYLAFSSFEADPGLRIWHFEPAPAARHLWLRIENRAHIVTMHCSLDDKAWTRHGLRLETSGYTINTTVPGEGENLRPALYAAGDGAVRYRDFRYRAL